MTISEITAAARLIRPHLIRELSMCRAVYPPTHPGAAQTASVERAIGAFDLLVQAMYAQLGTEQDKQDVMQQ